VTASTLGVSRGAELRIMSRFSKEFAAASEPSEAHKCTTIELTEK
jgi:hypothetical protein